MLASTNIVRGQQDDIDILNIDNKKVRQAQIARLERTRKLRDEKVCRASLEKLTQVAETGEGNILRFAIDAARARASVGEISSALEAAWGRHEAQTKMVSGIYGHSFNDDKHYDEVRGKIEKLKKELGRAPKILILKMGQDGHDRGCQSDRHRF